MTDSPLKAVSVRGMDMSSLFARPKPYNFNSNLDGALWWSGFGYRVMPMLPGKKRPALAHHPWLDDLSVEAIRAHWEQHPDHEVGAVLDDTQLILDADTPEADEALRQLEQRFGIVPSLIIKTRRGHHHHFRVKNGAFAKADSHSTIDHPDRLDVRSARNSALLTPSTDKSIAVLGASHRDGLSWVGQDFIDAVFRHNGRDEPRPAPDLPDDQPISSPTDITKVAALVEQIDADCGYQEWVQVLMAIYHETGGATEGLHLADRWSRKGKSYKDRADIEAKWRSFRSGVSNPVTIATLVARARDAGANTAAIMQDGFKKCETVVIRPGQPDTQTVAPSPAEEAPPSSSPLARYSLIGQSSKFEAMAQAATPLLGDVCLRGEATVWYAKHNTGKTLLFLHLAMEAIEQRRLDPDDLYYINADDSSAGIAVKMSLFDELGAHTLVPGQGGFKAEKLEDLLLLAVSNDAARGSLVVIDTLKKFVDLMNKRQASHFAHVCRQFVAAGGTILGLAHVNKRRSEDGKPIHAGTTDILDDFDAGYTIDDLELTGQPGQKFVEFKRLKARGGGVQSVAYAYAAEDHVSYAERLSSVRLVDQDDLDGIKRVEEARTDAEMVAVVEQCIVEGATGKMALRNAVSSKGNISRRAATKVIERYTGDDPGQHRWKFVRKARGAMAYELLVKSGLPDEVTTPPPP